MEIHITHQGQTLASLEITQDGKINAIGSAQPAAQYVWGSNGGNAPATQYVWGSNPGGGPAAQYVWGSNGGHAPAAQYVWGSNPGGGPAAQYVWGSNGGNAPAAQYVWGATNDRAIQTNKHTILVDTVATSQSQTVGIESGELLTTPMI
jgi:hypothetical protein